MRPSPAHPTTPPAILVAVRMRRPTAWARALALGALLSFAAPAHAGAASIIHVSVTGAQYAHPVPRDFLGLGLEYNTIPRWVGSGQEPVNPVLVQLIRNLDPGGQTVVRVGGQSGDRSWWPVPGMSRPLGVTYDLGPAWTASARAFAQAINARYLLGLNLEANRT